MALSITVNGGGTFTASMEEGPVSFTASLAAVGPAGPAGPGVAEGGLTGQVLAKASATNYDTEWVARNPFDQELNTTNSVEFFEVSLSTDGAIFFPDDTFQTTALPSGLADGNIVAWDADTSTYLSVPNDARTLFLNGTNKTGTTIAKGKAVYISGATGNHAKITLAIATSETTSARTIGITSEAIANNATGRVIVAGLLENVDTSAFAAGNVLYLSSSSAGGFQTTLPTQPNHGVLLGYVVRANANNGVIEVRVDNYQELAEQSDVLLTSKANGDFLVYESATSLWKNRTLASLDLLTATTAAATYQTQAGMSAYLTTSAAAATYYPLTGNPSGFLVSGDLSGYLLSSTAATTYAPIVHTHTASQVTDFDTAADARVNALVPAASTTAAGKVELATDAEARAATSSSVVVTPASFPWLAVRPGFRTLAAANRTAISGSGAVSANSGLTNGTRELFLSSLATGRAAFSLGFTGTVAGGFQPARGYNNRVDFSKKIWIAGVSCMGATVGATSYLGDANTVARIGLCLSDTSTANFANKGIGIKKVGGVSSYVNLTVHDGTNLTDVPTTYQNADGENFEWVIYSDGAGNVTLYINGSQAATTSAGPTGLGPANNGQYVEQVYAASLPGVRQNMWNSGGWLYIES